MAQIEIIDKKDQYSIFDPIAPLLCTLFNSLVIDSSLNLKSTRIQDFINVFCELDLVKLGLAEIVETSFQKIQFKFSSLRQTNDQKSTSRFINEIESSIREVENLLDKFPYKNKAEISQTMKKINNEMKKCSDSS